MVKHLWKIFLLLVLYNPNKDLGMKCFKIDSYFATIWAIETTRTIISKRGLK